MGGIQFPNVEFLVKTQNVAQVKHMVENKEAAWMQLLYTIVPYMEINHLLKCSIIPTSLSENIQHFYQQILFAWFELKLDPQTSFDIRREVIWFNKHINIGNEPVYYTQLYQRAFAV